MLLHSLILGVAALTLSASARPISPDQQVSERLIKREVPQEHSHEQFLTYFPSSTMTLTSPWAVALHPFTCNMIWRYCAGSRISFWKLTIHLRLKMLSLDFWETLQPHKVQAKSQTWIVYNNKLPIVRYPFSSRICAHFTSVSDDFV